MDFFTSTPWQNFWWTKFIYFLFSLKNKNKKKTTYFYDDINCLNNIYMMDSPVVIDIWGSNNSAPKTEQSDYPLIWFFFFSKSLCRTIHTFRKKWCTECTTRSPNSHIPGSKFSLVFLLDWLPNKAEVSSLPNYFIQS